MSDDESTAETDGSTDEEAEPFTDVDLPADLHPASVVAVARKDFQDAIRSRGLLILTAVFVVFFGVSSYLVADQLQTSLQNAANVSNASQREAARRLSERLTSDSFLRNLTDVTRLFIPLTAIVVSYASVIGERESGTLKLLLSLPHSRLDVVLGKVAGRSGTVILPVALGFVVAAPVFPLLDITFEATHFVLFGLLTISIGVVFVALSVGVSAAVETSRRAVIGLMVVYVLFTLMWGQITRALVQSVAERTDVATKTLFQLQIVLKHINPIATYETLGEAIYGGASIQVSLFSRPPLRDTYTRQFGELPIYLTDGALVVWLVVWTVVPLAVGYLTFRRSDL